MKTLLIITLMLLSHHRHAFAQSADINGTGGPIVTFGASLNAPLTKVNVLCLTNCSAATGTVTLQTGQITSGDYQNSSTFDNGGSFILSATDGTNTVSFNGKVTSSNWSSTKLANSTYTYTLTGTIQDSTTLQTGAFALTTNKVGPANQQFPGNATISSISIHLN